MFSVRLACLISAGLTLVACGSGGGSSSTDLAEDPHQDAYTDEWRRTGPDRVVYIPAARKGTRASNQHFIVFTLPSGDFFAVWTTGDRESHDTQHIVFSKSTDGGLAWAEPTTIAGPRVTRDGERLIYEGMASWGFPIYVEHLDRIYVFYNKEIGIRDHKPGFTGEMRFVYTDDEGDSWSREHTLEMPRKDFMAPDPAIPPNWIVWQRPVELDGHVIAPGTLFASLARSEERPDAVTGSESWFWRFDNILTEDDPMRLTVSMLPESDVGIRMLRSSVSRTSTAGEPTVVRLSDGRWFAVFRTLRGCVGYAVSTDQGRSWSQAQCLRYRDGGETVLQPTASCPLYPLEDGRFLLVFHNNDGSANGGEHPWDWRRNRTPAFYVVGEEMLDADQPIWFGRPNILADNHFVPWGPAGRTSVAVYTSFFEHGGLRWLWYPDRKHFLLGKFITDEMLDLSAVGAFSR